jgi:hypothetical protein
MSSRRLMNRLYYFTIEDEGMLAEAFARIDAETYAITYKVVGTEDVFVTTTETKDALDRRDVPYNLLAEEDSSRFSLLHTPLSKEELGEFEDPLKCLGLAHRAIAMACVGVNGESDLGFDLSEGGAKQYTYFTAPAGHTFIWRLFFNKEQAHDFLNKMTAGDKEVMAWAEALPLDSAAELKSFH